MNACYLLVVVVVSGNEYQHDLNSRLFFSGNNLPLVIVMLEDLS